MGTKQVCQWVCELCEKNEQTFSENKAPKNWCKASLMLKFNTGKWGMGELNDQASSFYSIDICDDCYWNKTEERSLLPYFEHKHNVNVRFMKKLWTLFTNRGLRLEKTNEKN